MSIKLLFYPISAFIIVMAATPFIITLSHKRKLLDLPDGKRKLHAIQTPNLGGIAIFLGVLLTLLLIPTEPLLKEASLCLFAAVVLLLLGIIDDLEGVRPRAKFLIQIIIALILSAGADIRISHFYGIFGIEQLPYVASIAISSFIIIFLVNAINLIDGINCLAAGVSSLACLVFSYCFAVIEATGHLAISLSLLGALLAFLWYNKTPAKIFMGDTGSLVIGLILSVLTIEFLELNYTHSTPEKIPGMPFPNAPVLTFGLLIIPIFDTCRVFVIRILKGRSIMLADRNHLHHRLLDLGLTHIQATATLIFVNYFILVLATFLISLPIEWGFVVLMIPIFSFNGLIGYLLNKRRAINKIPKLPVNYDNQDLATA